MTKRQNIALICVIAALAIVLVAVGGYFIDAYASSDGERRSDGFVYSVSGNTATISAYEGEDTALTIPARIAGRRVALIEEGFLDNTSVTEVIFSEDITMIELEEGVFEDNTKLTYVSLPDSLKEIPERAFSDCTGLVRVKLPSSLEKIGASAFEGCSNLETSGASGEKQFVLPDTLTEVGEDAFKDCGDLTSVTIGTGLKDIPDGMFDNCDSISSLTFAEGSTVEKIGEGAFRDNNLGKVTLPDSLKYIGAYSFENNDSSSFSSITVPAGVVTVSAYAFSGCTRLATVEFAAREDGTRDLEAIGSGAFMKTAADAMRLAEEMVSIGKGAGRKTAAVITDMDSPLGHAVGNALEVKEAVSVLKGRGPDDLKELSVLLAAHMYKLSFGASEKESLEKANRVISDGSAFTKLKNAAAAMGGDVSLLTGEKEFPAAGASKEIYAAETGYITSLDSETVGKAAGMTGAGRETLKDEIDYSAGILLDRKYGDRVEKGERLATLYGSPDRLEDAAAALLSAYSYGSAKPPEKPLVYKIIS